MSLQFPTTYNTAPIAYYPINTAILPLLQGAINRLIDESLWLDDADYELAYNALAELRSHMASQPTVDAGWVLIGPASGQPASPAWRRLLAVDLPAIAYSTLTGIPAEFSPTMHALNHSQFGSDPLTPHAIGAANEVHGHVITYASLSGIPSSFAPDAHAFSHSDKGNDPVSPFSIGAAPISHSHLWSNISNPPATYAPSAHASSHAAAGADSVTPAAIGAATTGHTHPLEAWTTATLQNSWVTFGGGYNTPGYYKDPYGIVHLRGMLKNGTTTGGTLLFTLPAGYRPPAIELFTVASVSAGNYVFGRVDINTSGQVLIQTGGNAFLSLDGITFRT